MFRKTKPFRNRAFVLSAKMCNRFFASFKQAEFAVNQMEQQHFLTFFEELYGE